MKKRILDIPSPITGGKLELCVDTAQTVFRGESVSYEKSFYHCVDSGLEYADEAMEAANLKNMYDAYCRAHGIPML